MRFQFTASLFPPPIAARFWSHVDKNAENGCWVWTAFIDHKGYGQWTVHKRALKASRVSYFLSFGEDPGSLFVCHRCDNPPCVNPAHLFLGTVLDNAADMVRKGRKPRGESSTLSKMTSAQVREMCDLYASGIVTVLELARRFNISHTTAQSIIAGERWQHVEAIRSNRENRRSGDRHWLAKLTTCQAQEIRSAFRKHDKERSVAALARKYSVARSTVYRVIRGETWK